MKLRQILDSKGAVVHTIAPNASLAEVVSSLVDHNVGSLVVSDQDLVVGIITERDILRATADRKIRIDSSEVRSHMTPSPITATPSDEVQDIMGLLTERRIRHLPVMENDKLVGIISIGDIVKAQYSELSVENQFLKEYIQS